MSTGTLLGVYCSCRVKGDGRYTAMSKSLRAWRTQNIGAVLSEPSGKEQEPPQELVKFFRGNGFRPSEIVVLRNLAEQVDDLQGLILYLEREKHYRLLHKVRRAIAA